MWRRLLVVAVVGCTSKSQPAAIPMDDTCKVDADCELLSAAPPNCCGGCGGTAVNHATALHARDECRKADSDYFARCPHYNCVCAREKAVCKAGQCVVDRQKCN